MTRRKPRLLILEEWLNKQPRKSTRRPTKTAASAKK